MLVVVISLASADNCHPGVVRSLAGMHGLGELMYFQSCPWC